MIKFLLIIIIVSSASFAQAQEKYDLSKYYNMPFKEDTVQPYNNQLVQDGLISSIKDSKAIIEIRLLLKFVPHIGGKGKLTYMVFIASFFENGISISYEQFHFYNGMLINKKSRNGYQRWYRSYTNYNNIDTAFSELARNKLFSISDQSGWLDSLKINNKDLYNKNESDFTFNSRNLLPILVELKCGKKYRNYFMQSFNDAKALKEIPELQLSYKLKEFGQLIYDTLQSENN